MSRPSDSLRDLYEQRGRLEYASVPGRPDSLDRKFERLSRAVADHLPCRAFLDAGCGDGRYLAALPSLGPLPGLVAGVDIAGSILATASATAAAADVPVELARANLESLPFEDGAFDLILCTQVIEHLLDPLAAVRELRRVLARDGTLVISTDHRGNRVSKTLNAPRSLLVAFLGLRGRRLRVSFPHRDFARAEFVELLRDGGLEIRAVETFRFHVTGAPPAIQRLLNWIDRRLAPHSLGDILLVECEP